NALNNMETKENDLKAFKEYIENERADENGKSGLYGAVNGVQYTYDFDLLLYTKNVDGTIIHSDTQELLNKMVIENLGVDLNAMSNAGAQLGIPDSMMSSMGGGSIKLWQEMLPGDNGKLVNDILEKQYNLVYGSWPTEYNEVVLVLDENNELDDLTLYALGLKSQEDMDKMTDAALKKTELERDTGSWSYEDICNMEFRAILNSDCYTYDEKKDVYTDLRDTDAGLRYLYDNGTPIKVSGIIKPDEEAVAGMLSGSIAYTSKLTEYVIDKAKDSPAVKAQQDKPEIDIFTGLPFKENTGNLSESEKAKEFDKYISDLSESEKAAAYIDIMSIPSSDFLDQSVSQTMGNMTREDMDNTMIQVLITQMGMSEGDVKSYISSMTDEEMSDLFSQMIKEQVKSQYAEQTRQQMSSVNPMQLAMALDAAMQEYPQIQKAQYYDEVLEFSESTYDKNMSELGCVDIDKPSSINLYAATFESKDVIEDAIAHYNKDVDELKQIKYTDYVGLMMSSITSIINAVTYVLIAFVAISLIVSSIMIGVITLISVQERTKEIGILRAIGASKHNVSSMFNAETVIIGFTSGLLGVIVTVLLCIPINKVIQHLTGIAGLKAYLPVSVAGVLVCISIILTLIAGIIPSRSAAKKDPVVALRSE
ncbi:MAG: FtsX-like permease family protein, partial [Lachnospira sp.]|nr:FtsX-like permease family protein [Lachnospira sp.]